MSQSIDKTKYFALRLRALHPDDSAWILSKLDEQTRKQIESLLEELQHIGFDIDVEQLDSIVASSEVFSNNTKKADAGDLTTLIKELDRANPNWLWQHIKDEPINLQRCIESTFNWSWLSVLRSLRAKKRWFKTEKHPNFRVTKKVQSSLISALLQRKMLDDKYRTGMPRIPTKGWQDGVN